MRSLLTDPVRCVHCQEIYDLGNVTVTARYADCSMWEAPCCGRQVDSRTWKAFKDYEPVSPDESEGKAPRHRPVKVVGASSSNATTIPCRQDPDAWDLPSKTLAMLTSVVAQKAVDAVAGCYSCPLLAKGECTKLRPERYEHRTVQDAEVFEPDRGWFTLDAWLDLAGFGRCRQCGSLTRNLEYCTTGCSGRARKGLSAKISPNCPSHTLHHTAWAWRKHGCTCPEAQRQRDVELQRLREHSDRPGKKRVKTVDVVDLYTAGKDIPDIADQLNVHRRTVERHLHRYERAQRVMAKAVA